MEYLVSLLRQLMRILAVPMEKPPMFGSFHIACALLLCVTAPAAGYALRRKTDAQRLRVIHAAGWILLAGEILKQLFLFFIVEHELYNWWWFPFQLCSMPMYLSILLPHLENRDGVIVFLTSYCLIAAVLALIYPQDMLREYVFLTGHAFVWHGIMLVIAFTLLFGHMVRFENRNFVQAFLLFLFLAGIAECINIYGYHHTVIPGTYPNMFYITPYYKNTQPVFRRVADTCGILPADILYLLTLSAGSFLLFLAEKRLS
ncbi:MAG: YwaF family protein [Solobacterium sp.]|nr:YwaF family protein [Solobacterium sp.]